MREEIRKKIQNARERSIVDPYERGRRDGASGHQRPTANYSLAESWIAWYHGYLVGHAEFLASDPYKLPKAPRIGPNRAKPGQTRADPWERRRMEYLANKG